MFKDNYRKISSRNSEQYENQLQKGFEAINFLENKLQQATTSKKNKIYKKNTANIDCDEVFIALNYKLDQANKKVMDKETELVMAKKEENRLVQENKVRYLYYYYY